jgi:surface antigen
MSAKFGSVPWAKRTAVVALVILLPACQSMEPKDARMIGGVIGSIGGAIGGSYLGSYLGGTAASIATSVIGGLAGSYIGAEIGGYLGRDDQQRMAEASKRAFETGETQTFSNSMTGVKGKAEIVAPNQAAQQSSTSDCKTIRQTIVLKDGTSRTEDVDRCK